MIYGALEAGGTKMVCAIGDETGKIIEQISIPTKTPEETMPQIVDYFKDKNIESLGIATFGPVDVHPDSPTYGHILDTPKTAWIGFDMLGYMKEALGVPAGIDTDVNGSLLGEVTWGSSKGMSDVVYITIGTGVGGGILSGGKIVHGMLHPELGHMKIVKHEADDYEGRCPYHGTCLEGLAAGPAIEARYGATASKLVDRDDVWEIESYYIAQAISNLICIVSPKKVILGGGVMHQKQLFPLIRKKVLENLNGYFKLDELSDIDNYIVPASLNDDQGIMGAIKIAMDAV